MRTISLLISCLFNTSAFGIFAVYYVLYYLRVTIFSIPFSFTRFIFSFRHYLCIDILYFSLPEENCNVKSFTRISGKNKRRKKENRSKILSEFCRFIY